MPDDQPEKTSPSKLPSMPQADPDVAEPNPLPPRPEQPLPPAGEPKL
jgi:hypothetical protein